jgi:hypothetical protein
MDLASGVLIAREQNRNALRRGVDGGELLRLRRGAYLAGPEEGLTWR